jgi:predicted metal-dependent HD superfamily phosphohydrolase
MRYNEIKKAIISELKNNLPKHLTYHSVNHVEDVIKAATEIGKAEQRNAEEIKLIKTAALFHDTGFLHGAKDHEANSCIIAQKYLPNYGFNQSQIDTIKGMIMATKIPQTPQNHLEEILADADLDYLGRDDFFTISDKLFDELTILGIISSERDWNFLQEKFLESHNFFTKTSNQKRKPKKEENLRIVKAKLL